MDFCHILQVCVCMIHMRRSFAIKEDINIACNTTKDKIRLKVHTAGVPTSDMNLYKIL